MTATALLTELRQLAQAYPDDAAVRMQRVGALLVAWIWLDEEGDIPEKEALVTELRDLLDHHADDDRFAQLRAWLDDRTLQ